MTRGATFSRLGEKGTCGPQWSGQRAHDLQALKELARILKDLSAFEDSARPQRGGTIEHEQSLAVEGRAVAISRTKAG